MGGGVPAVKGGLRPAIIKGTVLDEKAPTSW